MNCDETTVANARIIRVMLEEFLMWYDYDLSESMDILTLPSICANSITFNSGALHWKEWFMGAMKDFEPLLGIKFQKYFYLCSSAW